MQKLHEQLDAGRFTLGKVKVAGAVGGVLLLLWGCSQWVMP